MIKAGMGAELDLPEVDKCKGEDLSEGMTKLSLSTSLEAGKCTT